MQALYLALATLGVLDSQFEEVRWDDKYTAVLAKQLEHVKKKTYDVLYPALKGRQLVPVSHEAPAGAETITYRQWDMFGMAAIISNYADDLPLIDEMVEEFSQKVVGLGEAYQYSIMDLQRSAMAGVPLNAKKSKNTRRAFELKIEDISAVGDSRAGLNGMANHPNVTLVAPTTGNFATGTAAQNLADLIKLVNALVDANKDTVVPDTMVMSGVLLNLISTKPMSSTGDTANTVLKQFLATQEHVKSVHSWNKLATADAAGTGPRIVCYAKDPDVLTHEIPQEYQQLAPQAKNMAFVVNSHGRSGGVIVHYPIGMAYMDGC